jgi:lipid II:glycine glycyltransferase (peptidoglycan interpeptide bridge formation enzyme)
MGVRMCSTIQDYVDWDRFVFNAPGARYWQTYGWLKSYEPMGFATHVLIHETDNVTTGGVAFLSYKIPMVPWRIFIVPHGPIPVNPDAESWLPLMQAMDSYCRERGAIYAQMYPQEPSGGRALLSRLEECGFRHPPLFTSHDFSSPAVAVHLNGASPEDALLSFRPKTRQHIRHALSGDLHLRTDVDAATFDRIYELILENGRLHGYRPRPYASLRIAWDWFAANDSATFLQAWRGDELAGAILLVFTGQTAYYLAGAVRRGFEKYYPAEFLHWHGICAASRRQLGTYDLLGFGTEGVEQFKRGFKPDIQPWEAPRTKIYAPLAALALTVVDRRFRTLVRLIGYARAGRGSKKQS